MKKLIMTPIALSLLTFTLIGCGEGEDAILGSGGNEFTVINFEKVTSGTTDAVARIEQTYSRGKHKVVTRSIVRNYNGELPNTKDKIVLANDFEGNLYNSDIEVDKRTVKRAIYKKNTNEKFNYETTYEAYDLTGKKTSDYIVDSTVGKSRGIFTDLNRYKISANATFPAGSVCYIPITRSDMSFWTFDKNSPTNYTTMDEWVSATKTRFGGDRKPLRTTFLGGENNKHQIEQIKFFAERDEPEHIYNGLEYDINNKKAIYESDYIANGTNQPNTDIKKAVVYCNLINDIAADFLEQEIKKVYR